MCALTQPRTDTSYEKTSFSNKAAFYSRNFYTPHYEEFALTIDMHDYLMLKMDSNITEEFILTGWPNVTTPMDYIDQRVLNMAVIGYV